MKKERKFTVDRKMRCFFNKHDIVRNPDGSFQCACGAIKFKNREELNKAKN